MSTTDYRTQTLDELARRAGNASSRNALIGFDGFVDKIVKAVDKRSGQGKAFTPIKEIAAFGKRISDAAGHSANIELYPELEKIGGNGPIMAEAIRATGATVRYIGALGKPPHPVFEEFATATQAVSLCDPGITHAVEFDDGKIMLGMMASLDEITYSRLIQTMGEGQMIDAFSRADLIGMVNWTMIPNMTSLLSNLLERVFPNLGPRETGRSFFFDLADPAKRSDGDLRSVLDVISRYRTQGSVTLGLNLAEARQVTRVLGLKEIGGDDSGSLREAAARLRNKLETGCVVIHPRSGAACATKADSWYVKGPYCERPVISTGAGDHFNAGFSTAQMLGLTPPACLTVAVATSGQYVRTARSPSLHETAAFIQDWNGEAP